MIYRLLTKLEEWAARPSTRMALSYTTLHPDGTVTTGHLPPTRGVVA